MGSLCTPISSNNCTCLTSVICGFFAHSGVQDILCCVSFVVSISRLSIFIASSVFWNIYFKKISIKSRRPMLLVKDI